MRPQKERIQKLLGATVARLYERNNAIVLALLSAVAGESIFLPGMPGVGRSLVARRLEMMFRQARSFESLRGHKHLAQIA